MSNSNIIFNVIAQVKSKGKTDWNEVVRILKETHRISRARNSVRSVYQRHTKEIDLLIEQYSNGEKTLPKELETPVDKNKLISIELLADGTTKSERSIALSEAQMKNKEFMLKAHGFDSNEFEIVNATNNFWDSQTSEGKVLTLYQSKITVRPISERSDLKIEDIQRYVNELKKIKFELPKVNVLDTSENEFLFEIDWSDLHIGSLSWHEEVGEDNDYKIAFGNIKSVVAQIVEIIKTRKIKKVIHCFLGDFLHIDTGGLTTSGGTQVDFDSRPLKMIKKGFEIVRYIIDSTSFIPSEVKWVPGNHSKLVEFSVFYAMPMIYEKSDIGFDVTPKTRKILAYGKNLVGLAHGNDIGKKEKFTWLQYEFREEWANAEYTEIHMGHLHQEMLTEEIGGITIRVNPALKIIDKYEHDHAWISKKVVMGYLWHETKNLKEVFYIK